MNTDFDPQALIHDAWQRVLPSVLARVEVLRQAVADESMRPQAAVEAHRLAGSLGSYGLHDGSATARSIETALQESADFAAAVEELAAIVTHGPA